VNDREGKVKDLSFCSFICKCEKALFSVKRRASPDGRDLLKKILIDVTAFEQSAI
jgi:hypothetical protein